MAYEQRELSGSIFPNTRKEKDTHADWQGSCLIDGKEYWINGWNKDGAKGKWFSLTFKLKDRQSGAPSKPSVPVKPLPPAIQGNDDVPF